MARIVTLKVFNVLLKNLVSHALYRCFCICFDWKKLPIELPYLQRIFCKNGYPGKAIDKCNKKFLDNIHFVKENVSTVEKRRFLLVLPYFGVISLKTRTKLQHAFKGVSNCCKLEIAFKCQTKLSNSLRSKNLKPKDVISGAVYEFQCGLCNESYYDDSIRHLDIRSGERMGMSPLTGKKVKPIRENLKMRYKPSINRNFSTARLYLFDKVSLIFLVHFTVVSFSSFIIFQIK